VLVAFVHILPSASFAERCGGTERWYAKAGTDPRASQVDVANPVSISVVALNALPKLQGTVPHNDNKTRLDEETRVYTVSGYLAIFKDEDDDDYHLVITDGSLDYTPGGPQSAGKETGTSFIAEFVHPDCVAGMKGPLGVASEFQTKLQTVRQSFEARFPQGKGADTPQGIPVTVTGVAFYDRPHYQTGRAVNGMELHPVLNIVFEGTPIPPPPPGSELLSNTGFEEGATGWAGTLTAIGTYPDVAALVGQKVCWLAGYGRKKTETIAQTVTIPSTASSVTLSFWVDIGTEETSTTASFDRCVIQVRSGTGQVLRTLDTLSNLNETGGYLEKRYDLSTYKGRTVEIYLKATEDSEKATSFMLDDFSVKVK
jgi:hypothetical protein